MIRDGVIEYEVRFAHPPERVWRALTDPAELSAWLLPNDFEAEPGHRFSFDARPELGIIIGDVLDAEPPRLLRCQWAGAFGDTIVTFELAPEGSGTRLHVTHRGWTDDFRGYRDGFDGGWQDKLATDLPALLALDGPTGRA